MTQNNFQTEHISVFDGLNEDSMLLATFCDHISSYQRFIESYTGLCILLSQFNFSNSIIAFKSFKLYLSSIKF